MTFNKNLPVRKEDEEFKDRAGKKWNEVRYTPFPLRKVRYGELTMIFSCRTVVGLGRPDFATETAKKYMISIKSDVRLPELMSLIPGNTLVFRAVGSFAVFGTILDILGACGRSKIGFSIVQAISVDVIHK